MSKPSLVELIQLHERKWGETQYPGRPTLDQLLNSYVLVMWTVGKRVVFSVHSDMQQLNDLLFNLITGKVNDPEQRKLARIFINRIEHEFRIGIVPRKIRPPTKPSSKSSYTVEFESTGPTLERDPDKEPYAPQAIHPLTGQPVPLSRQPEIVPLRRQPRIEPLPPEPGKKHGQNLPGRHVTPLPGRTVKLRRGKKN